MFEGVQGLGHVDWDTLIRQDALWRKLCDGLWDLKSHVPQDSRIMYDSEQCRGAFTVSSSLQADSITTDELVNFTFSFRFKRTAGRYWTDKDPFWTENQPLCIKFLPNGSISGFPWDTPQMNWHFVEEGAGSKTRDHICGWQ